MVNKSSIVDEATEQARARLLALAEQQGVKPLRFDELRGDFWPEDERTDDFLAWLHKTRQESLPRRLPE